MPDIQNTLLDHSSANGVHIKKKQMIFDKVERVIYNMHFIITATAAFHRSIPMHVCTQIHFSKYVYCTFCMILANATMVAVN